MSYKTLREILRLLMSRPLTEGEFADQFELSAATVSHHLSVLKTSGLITSEKRAQTIIYSLNTTVFQDILKMIAGFLE